MGKKYDKATDLVSVVMVLACSVAERTELLMLEPELNADVMSVVPAMVAMNRVMLNPVKAMSPHGVEAAILMFATSRVMLLSIDEKSMIPSMSGAAFRAIREIDFLVRRFFDELGGEVAFRAAAARLSIVAA